VKPPPQSTPKPLEGPAIAGKSYAWLNHWCSRDKLLIIAEYPVREEIMRVGEFVIRQGNEQIGVCVGIVPPEKFSGAMAGSVSGYRHSSIGVGDLAPVFRKRSDWGPNPRMEFSKTKPIRCSFIVGDQLTVDAREAPDQVVSAPTTTYLLFASGQHIAVSNSFGESESVTIPNGLWMPRQKTLKLLFVVTKPGKGKLTIATPGGVIHPFSFVSGV
jgi:hypothetical protein